MIRIFLILTNFLILTISYSQVEPNLNNLIELAGSESRNYNTQENERGEIIGANYDLKYHRLEWEINPEINYIRGSVTSYFIITSPETEQISFELVSEMDVDSVIFRNSAVDFNLSENDELKIMLNVSLPYGTSDSVTVFYQGVPVSGNETGSFVQSTHNDIPIIWTLSEPYGAKSWWPCKNDLSDKIDSIDIYLSTPAIYQAVSNGLLIKEFQSCPNIVYHWKHGYPIAAYLIGVAVTNYVKYSDWAPIGNDTLEILNYVFPEDLDHAQSITPESITILQLFSELFTPYPFLDEHYGHTQWGKGGGMEHQTMTFLGTFQHEIIAHEIAHSWFGNDLTLNSWHDIWLNEGFATYFAGLTYEHMFDGKFWPIWKNLNIGHVTSEPGGSVYVEDTTSRERIFSARLSYSKGALLAHMIRWIIGDENFYSAMRNYLQDPDLVYNYVGNDDLIEHLETVSGVDLTEFFEDWYYGEGYPIYNIKCNSLEGTELEVFIYQEQSHPSVEFFEMPVPILFKSSDQDTTFIFNNTYSGQRFTADPGFITDSVFFDPEQWLISDHNSVIFGYDELDKNIIQIFPNPFKNAVTLHAESYQIDRIEVFNLNGKLVFDEEFETYHTTYYIMLDKLTKGVYLVNSTIGDRSISHKIIKL